MVRISFLLALSTILLAACQLPDNNFSAGQPQLVAEPDNVSALLADAADRAANSLQALAAVERARTPGAALAPIGDAPVELKRAITVNWIGPVESISQTLAERAGYRFATVGAAPPTPVIVSIDVENRPVIEVLRDIGLQIGNRGDIKVNGSEKLVELNYPPNTGLVQ
jgi:defect-in-organelle-trafficking protein DotD